MTYDYEKLWCDMRKNLRMLIKLLEAGANSRKGETATMLLMYNGMLEDMDRMEEYQRIEADMNEP